MCGICGKINFSSEPVESSIINNMCSALSHRGPNDRGIYTNNEMGLGHVRLSIIDLSPAGHQPMSNENKQIWIVFNGEIYNYKDLKAELEMKGHKFNSNTDTEVIIHLYEEYGRDCVTKLNGMFAFAIWDESKKEMFLARDRVGIKPLFYFFDNEKLVFGSEIKSILQDESVKREIDLQALHDYLTFLYVPAPNTIFKKIKKLLPGHILICKGRNITVKKYWDLNYDQESEIKSEDYYAEGLLELLKKSIKRRLISDVPLGAFLSGGIDSSAIVGLMSKLMNEPVKTFSIGFRSAGYHDERKYAMQIADMFKTEHHELEVEPDAVELLPKLVYHFDEPFADSSAVPIYLVSKMAKEYVTVILSGTGGDDILGGYRRYFADRLAEYYLKVPGFVNNLIHKIVNELPVSRTSIGGEYLLLMKKFIDCAPLAPEIRYISLVSFFSEDMKKQLYFDNSNDQTRSLNILKSYFANVHTKEFLNKTLYVDLKTYVPDDLLVKEDRMTMAVGLEGRVPFLDHELIEFAATIPSNLKLKGFTTKYILKKSLANLLPKNIINRRKHGFAVPIGEWLKKDLKDFSRQILLESRTRQRGYFNHKYVEELLRRHQSGKQDFSQHLWSLLILELWHRVFIDSSKVVEPESIF